MNDEIDDEILESELADDALEKRMRKLEAESARLLDHSNELVKMLSKDKAKTEEAQKEEAEGEKKDCSKFKVLC